MRRIELSDGRVYATNESGYGAFVRRSCEGAYKQIAGTCETPQFCNWRQFRRWLGALGARVVAVCW